MTLVTETLNEKISEFADQASSLFINFPESIADNAQKWADAIDSYASIITPVSTTSNLAKASFLGIMQALQKPADEPTSFLPFTIYYKSPELRLRLFINYLNELGYTPSIALDKSKTIGVLKDIMNTYNSRFPSRALSAADIEYNQRRFNIIFASEIRSLRKFTLLPDGVTIDQRTTTSKYFHIPVNPQGIIIALQEDGIIGDDTIRYLPLIFIEVYSFGDNHLDSPWNIKYATIPFITQPGESGDVVIRIPTFSKKQQGYNVNNSSSAISSIAFKRDYIDKGLSKDYTKVMIDKTQAQIDGNVMGLGTFSSVLRFQNIFEANHIKSDPIWIKNKISSIEQYQIFLNKEKVAYKSAPDIQKNGIKVLEQAIITYATVLATGMQPAFTGTVNPVPLSLSPVIAIGSSGGSNEACIKTVVSLIDAYFRGGIAVNNTSGASTTWV